MPKNKAISFQIEEIKPYVIPGLIFLLILISALFLVKPRLADIIQIQKELKKEKERLSQLTAKLASLESLDVSELTERAELTLKVLPGEKNLPLLLFRLKSLAVKNRLGLEINTNPGELATDSAQTKDEKLPVLSFLLNVNGQMNDLKEFLSQLNQEAPLVRVQSLEISADEKVVLKTSSDLTLDSYFLSLPLSLGVSEKPLSLLTPKEEEIYQELSRLKFLEEKEMKFPSLPSGKENPFTSGFPAVQD